MAGALWPADVYAASNIVMRISDSPLNLCQMQFERSGILSLRADSSDVF